MGMKAKTETIAGYKVRMSNYGNVTRINEIDICSISRFGGDCQNTMYKFFPENLAKLGLSFQYMRDLPDKIQEWESYGTLIGTTSSGVNAVSEEGGADPVHVAIFKPQ